MKKFNAYQVPCTEVVPFRPRVNQDNPYNPDDESGLVQVSGSPVDASLGESNSTVFVEEEVTAAPTRSLWDE